MEANPYTSNSHPGVRILIICLTNGLSRNKGLTLRYNISDMITFKAFTLGTGQDFY